MKKLLTKANPKVIKGIARGFVTAILHFASAKKSGYNVCPWATAGCSSVCLDDHSGRGRAPVTKKARRDRTRLYFEHPDIFHKLLRHEIKVFVKGAKRKGLTPALRLNGTSDLPELAIQYAREFPEVQFYDYTKGLETLLRDDLPSNYHLTFSRSESNDHECKVALANGYNVATVFDDKPETFWGYPVIDGDEDDLRFLDSQGAIIALKPKGDAVHDARGFVVRGA
jgi:hypothetical protein